jgi:hypothetical protein
LQIQVDFKGVICPTDHRTILERDLFEARRQVIVPKGSFTDPAPDPLRHQGQARATPANHLRIETAAIWRDFCFNRMSMAQTPVELGCIGGLRLAKGHAGDLR